MAGVMARASAAGNTWLPMVPVKKIVGWSRRPATKLVVCLVGVQTNQFPRALDLGRQFRAHGLDVLMGGFHTSCTINMLSEQEPDIQ